MFGRPLFVREDYETSYEETLKQFFKDMDIPVIYDVDCGHVSPQLPIVTGAILEVESSNGKGTGPSEQRIPPYCSHLADQRPEPASDSEKKQE